jgi:hypothetical protein
MGVHLDHESGKRRLQTTSLPGLQTALLPGLQTTSVTWTTNRFVTRTTNFVTRTTNSVTRTTNRTTNHFVTQTTNFVIRTTNRLCCLDYKRLRQIDRTTNFVIWTTSDFVTRTTNDYKPTLLSGLRSALLPRLQPTPRVTGRNSRGHVTWDPLRISVCSLH